MTGEVPEAPGTGRGDPVPADATGEAFDPATKPLERTVLAHGEFVVIWRFSSSVY
jgi:hypothetical protein